MSVPSQPEIRNGPREPDGPLWAYPVFLLGLGVFILALIYGPLPFTGPTGALRRIATLREKLEATQAADLADWLEEAEKIAALAPRQDIQVKAKLLLAEGWLRRATVLPADEAAQRIKVTQEELGALGIPRDQADAERKNYLLALAKYQTGEDMPGAIRELTAVPEDSSVAAESLDLLVKCYLKLPIPDPQGALVANERLRSLGMLTDEQRGQAQLSAGELLLKLQKPEEARRVLDKVGSRVSSSVRNRAGILLAQSFQDQGMWTQAAEAWQNLLDSETSTDAQMLSTAWLSLGICHQKSEQPIQAGEAFEKVLEFPPNDSSPQAHLLLGQQFANEKDAARSLAHFQAALGSIKTPNQWHFKVVDLARARLMVESTVDQWLRAKNLVPAMKLAELNMAIAEPSRGTFLLAQVLESQARAFREPGAWEREGGKEKALAQSRKLFMDAAKANLQVAETLTDQTQQAAHLWLAAKQCQEGMDHNQTVELLTRFLRAAPNTDKSGEAWYLMGESLAALNRNADSLAAYRECIKFLTPFSYRARYRIGADAMLKGNLDVAAETLEHNLQMLRLDPDPEAQELSLYTLGWLYFQRKDWKMVMRRLEEALERYPKNSQHLKARMRLADAYRNLAFQEHQNSLSGEQITAETRAHFQAEHKRWLERAVATYTDIRLALEIPQMKELLDQEELDLVGPMLADTWFNLGRYSEALRLYEEQVIKLEGRKEQLVALGGSIRCYTSMGKMDQVKETLERIRKGLPLLDEKTRKDWEAWVNAAAGLPRN